MSIALPAAARDRLEDLPARASAVYQALVRAGDSVTPAELQEATALHERTVQRGLKDLREGELVDVIEVPEKPARNEYGLARADGDSSPPRYQL